MASQGHGLVGGADGRVCTGRGGGVMDTCRLFDMPFVATA